MAAQRHLPLLGALPGLGWPGWLLRHLLSLETLLVMFVFGAHLKLIVPSPPALPETVFYGLASILVGGWIVLRQGLYLRGVPMVLAGLAFTAWMLVSYGWSASTVVARDSLVFVLGINLWALLVAACVVAESRERLLRLLVLLVACAVVISAYGAYIELVHGNFRFYRGPNGDWPFRTYLAWGNVVGPGAGAALGFAIHTRLGSARNLLALGALAICLYFLLFCGPRGPLLGLGLGMAAIFLVNLPRLGHGGRIELPRAGVLGFVLLAGAVGYLAYAFGSGEATATLNRFAQLLAQAQDPLLRTGPNRFDYYAGAWQAWLAAPLLGQGMGGFTVFFCHREDPGCHPHNVLLQALADYGLVGLVLYAVFLWTALHHVRPSRLRDDRLMMVLFLAFVPIAVYAMVAATLLGDHRVVLFLGLLALRPALPASLPAFSSTADEADEAGPDRAGSDRAGSGRGGAGEGRAAGLAARRG